jgi:hypothetical protein
MNWDALGAIAELLGAIAVFLTLAYLTVQVRQNSKALELQNKFSAAQIMQARTDTLTQVIATSSSAENLAALQKISQITGPESLGNISREEQFRLTQLLNMYRGMFENIIEQYKMGFLTKEFYEGSPAKNLATFAPAFLALKVAMSDEFEAEVKRLAS